MGPFILELAIVPKGAAAPIPRGIGSEDDLGVFPLVAAHRGEPVPITYELFPPEDIGSCFGV